MGETGERRPRVVVVAQAAPAQGGIATFARLLTLPAPPLDRFEVEVLNTTRRAVRRGGVFSPATVRWALVDAGRVFLAARRSQVVHLNTALLPLPPLLRVLALIAAAKLAGSAVLLHVHSEVNTRRGPFEPPRVVAWLLRRLRAADAIVVVSERAKSTLEPFVGRDRIEVLDNPVDLRSVGSACPDGEVPTVLFVGTISVNKGLYELIEAAVRLRERGVRGWRLQVIGGANEVGEAEARAILQKAADAGIADSFLGSQGQAEVLRRLTEGDIFVLPSHSEGQPLSVLEAMATGLPIVATRVGAIPDLVRCGEEGLLVEPGDIDGLAEAIERLVEDRQLRTEMGARAAARARDRHSLDGFHVRVAAIYRQLALTTGADVSARRSRVIDR